MQGDALANFPRLPSRAVIMGPVKVTAGPWAAQWLREAIASGQST